MPVSISLSLFLRGCRLAGTAASLLQFFRFERNVDLEIVHIALLRRGPTPSTLGAILSLAFSRLAASLLHLLAKAHEVFVVVRGIFVPRSVLQDRQVRVDTRVQRVKGALLVLRACLSDAKHGVGDDHLKRDVVLIYRGDWLSALRDDRGVLSLPVLGRRAACTHVVQRRAANPRQAAGIPVIALGRVERGQGLGILLRDEVLLRFGKAAIEPAGSQKDAAEKRERNRGHDISNDAFHPSLPK